VVDGIDHGVEDGYGEDSLAFDKRKVRLALTAQTYCHTRFIAANALANCRIFDKEAENHEVKMSVVGSSGREVGVLEEV